VDNAAGPTSDPLRFGRETRLSPMPKDFRVQTGRIRTLAIAKQAAVLTDLDAATFEVRKQARGLPLAHRLFLAPDGFSLEQPLRLATAGVRSGPLPSLSDSGPRLQGPDQFSAFMDLEESSYCRHEQQRCGRSLRHRS
jgi:hypothetical protein